MLGSVLQQFEKFALRVDPRLAIGLFNLTPPAILTTLQEWQFRSTLRLAAKAPFYAEQFAERGIDASRVRRPADLGDFFTTSEDLAKYGPEAFLTGRADTAFETTGTTSNETKRVFFSTRELDEMGRTSALGLYQIGLRRDDVVVSAFDISFWVSPAVLRTALQYVGCFHVEAGKLPPEEFYDRARRYRPNVVFGEPSWMMRFSEVASRRGTWPVKFLFAGGENIDEQTRSEIERIWEAPFFVNYGQTESFGVIGVECSERDGYHRNDLNFIFEIADADEYGVGELVYTTLTRRVMPLIRYRSNDVTALVDEPCKCGLFAKRIAKIKGRVDEMVVCGMGNISPWVFGEILRCSGLTAHEWQVRVWHEHKKDVVEWRIEVADGFMPQEQVIKAAENGLKAAFPDFSRNLEMGLYKFRVVPVQPGALRTARKLRRLVVVDPSSIAEHAVSTNGTAAAATKVQVPGRDQLGEFQ